MNGSLGLKQGQSVALSAQVSTGIKRRVKGAELTQQKVREVLTYNPETGVMRHHSTLIDNRTWLGRNGYVYLSLLDGSCYAVHRLVWLWVHGYWPENDIDHINRKRNDNRLCNLREATRSCNLRNSSTRRDNTTGIRGVYRENRPNRKPWYVRITGCDLGSRNTFYEAAVLRFLAENNGEYGVWEETTDAELYLQGRTDK